MVQHARLHPHKCVGQHTQCNTSDCTTHATRHTHNSGCLTPAISWAKWLHHPRLLGVHMVGRNRYGYITPTFSGSTWWAEINMATSPLSSWAPHGGEKSIWLHHPCFLGVPVVGRNQYGYITLVFLGSPWWGEINMATSPLPSRGPHGGQKSIWLHHPCLLGVHMVGRNQYGYITPTFSGSPWWAEINMATSPLPSRW